jgi:hypothetical protein
MLLVLSVSEIKKHRPDQPNKLQNDIKIPPRECRNMTCAIPGSQVSTSNMLVEKKSDCGRPEGLHNSIKQTSADCQDSDNIE